MKQIDFKKLIIPNIPYFAIGLFATKVGQAIRLAPGTGFEGKLMHIMEGFTYAFADIFPSFNLFDILIGATIAAAIRLAVYVKNKNAKKYRKNEEYGSARWGTHEDIAPFVDPVFDNNIILTQTESLMMCNRPKEPKNARNKNVLIVGGSGSGRNAVLIETNN